MYYVLELTSLLTATFYAVFLLFYSQTIIKRKVSKIKLYGTAIILSFILSYLGQHAIMYPLVYIFMYVLLFIIFHISFEGSVIIHIFATSNFMFHLMCLKGIVVALIATYAQLTMMEVIIEDTTHALSSISLFSVATLFLLFFQKVYTRARIKLLLNDVKQLRMLVSIQSLLNITLLIAMYSYYVDVREYWIIMYHLMISFMMLAGFYIVFKYIIQTCETKVVQEHTDILNYQIKCQLEQYQKQSEYIRVLRRMKHDFTNQLTGLTYILEEEKCDRGLGYVEELLGILPKTNEFYQQYSNHILVDAILQDIKLRCDQNDIKFQALLTLPALTCTDLQLCTLFSNIMNNALEANLKARENRFICIHSEKVNEWMLVRIENRFSGKLLYQGENLKTTKADTQNHGYGLLTIQKIIEDMHGIVHIEPNETDNIFCLRLLIPLSA